MTAPITCATVPRYLRVAESDLDLSDEELQDYVTGIVKAIEDGSFDHRRHRLRILTAITAVFITMRQLTDGCRSLRFLTGRS